MAAQKSVIILVKQFIKEVEGQGVKLHNAILFGSNATGHSRQHSDIDLALVSDAFLGIPFKDLDLFIKAKIKKVYNRIHIQTFPKDYFEKGDPFIEEIKKTGIELIEEAK